MQTGLAPRHILLIAHVDCPDRNATLTPGE